MTGGSLVKLAKQAAEHYVRYKEHVHVPAFLSAELLLQRACYVSIYERPGHHVRAMYGYPLPRHPSLAHEIIMNTTQAIRYQQVGSIRQLDLSHLLYGVSVLGPLQRVTSKEHLDPMRFGLYVRSDRDRSAVLLPQRTGIETSEEQIATAMREAGIDTRSEVLTMYRFAVDYYE